MASSSFSQPAWWKESVIYQVYPASFKDSTNTGWGDLKGITSKLDHIRELGANIVWSSPFCRSPQRDMGYDISDYCDVDPIYGKLADADELIAELKKREMRLMIDLVVNHTSDQHAWFLESKSSKESKKRDWYIWRPAKIDAQGNRVPPNNWSMILGEKDSAWTWDEATGEYFLSLFTPYQPDLNWENPEVRKAVHDVLRFWLDRGACGFRMDVINLISKVPDYPDGEVVAPDHKYQPGFKYFANGPRLHEYLHEMNVEVLSKYDAACVGEMPFVRDEDEVLRVVHPDRKELNMIFQFELVDVDNIPGSYRMTLFDWKRSEIRRILGHQAKMMQERGGWNSVFIENHDNPRSVSRYTSDADDVREICAKTLALMMTTLSGTLFVYQGQELGMKNYPADMNPEEYMEDVEAINYWKKMHEMYPGNQEMIDHAAKVVHTKSRDHARTPIPWAGEAPNAGFTGSEVKPWMKFVPDFKTVNAEVQRSANSDEKLSVFQFWKRGLSNRQEHKEAFVYGQFEFIGDDKNVDDPIFAYTKIGGGGKWVVVLNFSPDERSWETPPNLNMQQWVAGSYVKGKPEKATKGSVSLHPWEGILGQCKN
jgi:glycosidase